MRDALCGLIVLGGVRRGRDGERRAAMWLRMKGWSILGQRVKTKLGEIDLIARDGETVVFIEVKKKEQISRSQIAR